MYRRNSLNTSKEPLDARTMLQPVLCICHRPKCRMPTRYSLSGYIFTWFLWCRDLRRPHTWIYRLVLLLAKPILGLKKSDLYKNISTELTFPLRSVFTIESNLQAGSEGCAPTPSQYFALTKSNLISLNGLPSPSVGGIGIGSYVPK